jgi:hypothetical protein
MFNPYIKTPRQRRALEALLKGPISVRDLGPTIGALNPRQIISELRKQGFEIIIKTRFFEVIDRYGEICHPGEYYIPDELKPIVIDTLKENSSRAPGTRPRAKKKSDNSDSNERRF